MHIIYVSFSYLYIYNIYHLFNFIADKEVSNGVKLPYWTLPNNGHFYLSNIFSNSDTFISVPPILFILINKSTIYILKESFISERK